MMVLLRKLEQKKWFRALEIVIFTIPFIAPAPFVFPWLYTSQHSRMQGDLFASIAFTFAAGAITWAGLVVAGLLLFLAVYMPYSYIKYGPAPANSDSRGPG